MIRIVLLSLALAAPALAGYPPTPGTGTFTTIEGLEYARIGNDPLLLDLRVPDGAGPFPVIVYLHSGAWITGDRTGGPAIRQAARGYAVASIDYPLAPRYIWPSQLEAAKAAVRWVRANAARFNLDSSRIGAFGTSAGGHIAAMLGTTAGRPEFEGLALGNPQFSSAVKAVVDYYGPTDLLKMDEQKLPCYGNLSANSPFMPPSLLMGCPIQQCTEKTATSNPINYVTSDAPPFLIMQGLLDCLTPWKQSQMLYDALRANGVNATLYLLPTAQHADSQFDEQKYKQIVSDFFDQNLRGPLPMRRRAVR
ncbi:MAG: alpha/beta hydrolase fold domain-containing protein [Thermoanaerobaculia bacterium]